MNLYKKNKIIAILLVTSFLVIFLGLNFFGTKSSLASAITNEDFLKTSGTDIVKKDGTTKVVLKGYNLGLWFSRSYWGIPVYSNVNDRTALENNSMSMNSEMFNSKYLSNSFESRADTVNRILGKGKYKEEITLTKKEIECILNETFNNETEIENYLNINNNYGKVKMLLVETLNKVYYKNFITGNDIKTIANTGANVVRLPFDWTFFMKPKIVQTTVNNEKKYYYEPLPKTLDDIDFDYVNEKMKYLEEAIKLCKENGLYVILDMHIGPGNFNDGGTRIVSGFFQGDDKNTAGFYQSIALTIWKKISEKFCNEPAVAGYDLVNEADFLHGNKESVRNYYDLVYNELRNLNDNHIIIMGTQFHFSDYWMGNEDPAVEEKTAVEKVWSLPYPKDKGYINLVYSTHDYLFPTQKYNLDGENQYVLPETYEKYVDFSGSRFTLSDYKGKTNPSWKLSKFLSKSAERKNIYNVPLYVGEFNLLNVTSEEAEDKTIADNKKTQELWKEAIELYLNEGISITSWTYKCCAPSYEGMFYFSRNNSSIVKIDNKYSIWIRRFKDTKGYNDKNGNDIVEEQAQIANGRILLEYATFEEIETVFKGITANANANRKDVTVSTLNKLYDEENTVYDDIPTSGYTLNYMRTNTYLPKTFKAVFAPDDDQQPDDLQPDDQQPDDLQPDDQQPDDLQPDDLQPDDQQSDDLQPDDQQLDDTTLGSQNNLTGNNNINNIINNKKPGNSQIDKDIPYAGGNALIGVISLIATAGIFSFIKFKSYKI